MSQIAHIGASVFDGTVLRESAALLMDGTRVLGFASVDDLPDGTDRQVHAGGVLMPGFVDLQVNGGGGVMLGDDPSVETVMRMAAAHRATGTLGILPTLITDHPAQTTAVIDSVAASIAAGVPGVLGLHLEGPHLAQAKAGAHDPDLIRPMTDADEAELIDAAARLPNLMVTLAPECVAPKRIERLSAAGVIVSLGHSACTFDVAQKAIAAGARVVTHLFNAMSQSSAREPGLVGAALASGAVHAGLIADGIHVHPEMMRSAWHAKTGPGQIFLVSDAMAAAGSELSDFTLGGRVISRQNGRLTLADGTLAGADLDMARAVRCIRDATGTRLDDCLAMATSIPAQVLKDPMGHGRLAVGETAHVIHLSDDLKTVTVL